MQGRIVGQHGEDRFLVQIDPATVRILDLEHRYYFPPTELNSVVARESWDPPSTDRSLEELLDEVEIA
jgi:hypothetical protein